MKTTTEQLEQRLGVYQNQMIKKFFDLDKVYDNRTKELRKRIVALEEAREEDLKQKAMKLAVEENVMNIRIANNDNTPKPSLFARWFKRKK